MYNFYFGSKKEIEQNPERFLLSVKRMMPKWMNSIPDSEFLALCRICENISGDKPVLVETGSGASSLALLYHAMKNKGKLYTWDTNGEKLSLLRSVAFETIGSYFDMDVNKHWKTINYFSTSEYAGLGILDELNEKIDLFFHDSDHVLDVITKELSVILKLIKDPGYICIDDANYNFKHTNTAFINIIRKKLNLNNIKDITNNKTNYFYIEVENYLKNHFSNVTKINDSYKTEFNDDIYFDYFNNELKVKADLKMENMDLLSHRFDCWKISK